MKKYEKEEYQAYLNSEKATISSIKKAYEEALAQVDEKIRVLSTRTDIENMPSIIHQKKYQEQIKGQLEDILGKLQENQYKTVNDYLNDCYSESFLRSMYSLNQQGIPFAWPIDQKAVERAVTLDSKISGGLYSSIGVDVAAFKKNIASEISRGIASSLLYSEIARNLKNASKVPISNASRIVRTEGHRIQNQAKLDTMSKAKEKGADVVKQWDSTLDGKTRSTHRQLDGQIRELDEDFEVGGMKASAPGMFGNPAEDCNCRCAVLQRARWALGGGFTKMDNFTKELQSFESAESYEEFKKDYWSKENIKYMNYVTDMEEKYGTKNFEKVLESMSNREYSHYQKLLKADSVYKSLNFSEQEILKQEVKISKKVANNRYSVDRDLVNSKAFHDKFEELEISKNSSEKAYELSKSFLEKADGTEKEYAAVLDARTGKEVFNSLPFDNAIANKVAITESQYNSITSYKGDVILLHNHPASGRPSGTDILTAYRTPNAVGSLVSCHDGTIFYISDIRKDSGIDKIYQKYYDGHVRKALGIPDNEKLPDQIDADVVRSCKIKATTDLYKENSKKKYFSVRSL